MSYQIYYCQQDPQAEYVVLSSGLGGHASFWQPQIAVLQKYYHVLVYDQEGCHAYSEPLKSQYTMSDMAKQLLDILKLHNIQHCHLVGHALGALIGIELAYLMRPYAMQLLSLTCINAWDQPDVHTLRCFNARIRLLEHVGKQAYVEAQALFLYPPAWISKQHDKITQQEQQQLADFPPIHNVLARIRALSAFTVTKTHQVALQQTRLHFIANRDDFLVPYQKSTDLKHALGHGQISILNTGAHASTMTETQAMNQVMLEFLHPALA